ncbi:hypothetical protein FF125_02360 [Aureibaculum algae]|uniref:Uncharacterized protein n=1 Tax=Aureibaculum algae TaxID=2584122 RepID=A0A5B7TLS6_9FLAO|nr:hypothetical protein [Aureibaculum algae]QCX37335.1 hypothetical protein FF125_02360 [Aureibaculum algae]
MDTKILLAIVALILGLLYFALPKIYNYYLKRPKLVVDIEPNKGITSSQKFIRHSSKNPVGVPVNTPEGISIYEFEWKFDLTIRNNSEVNAFNIKMCQRKNSDYLNFKKNINPNKALKAHEEETIPFIFSKVVETKHKDRESHFTKRPSEFKDLMLLLEYENEYGQKFYSRYYFNTDKTDYKKTSETELKYWC